MAKAFHAIVRLDAKTLIPEDAVENTFSFVRDDAVPDGNAVGAVESALQAFYANLGGDGILGRSLAGTGTCTVYKIDLTTNSLHSPLEVVPISFAPANTISLPSEVALVAGMHADLTNIPEHATTPSPLPTPERAQDEGAPATYMGLARPAQRLRGRVYLGHLASSVATEDANNQVLVAQAKVAVVTGHMFTLQNNVAGLAVWSRANKNVVRVTGGFVDNAFDTQRRRGVKATSRNIYPAG